MALPDSIQPLKSTLQLVFTSFWLVFWSLGVAFIQVSLLGGEWLTLLFAFTHGGSEVFVLWVVSRMLADQSHLPTQPERTVDVGGTRLVWRAGSSTTLSLVVSVLLPLVVYPILFTPLVLALGAGPTWTSGAMIAAFAAVWLWTLIGFWVPTWRAQWAGLAEVSLDVAANGVRVQERWPGRTRTIDFPAGDVTIYRRPRDGFAELVLTARDAEWTGRIPSDASHAIAAVEKLFAQARATAAGVQVPHELKALRGRAEPVVEG